MAETFPEDLVAQRRREIADHLGLRRNLRISLSTHESGRNCWHGARFPDSRDERGDPQALAPGLRTRLATLWIHAEILITEPPIKHNESMAYIPFVEDTTMAHTIQTSLSIDKMTFRAVMCRLGTRQKPREPA